LRTKFYINTYTVESGLMTKAFKKPATQKMTDWTRTEVTHMTTLVRTSLTSKSAEHTLKWQLYIENAL
jgi:hypothetical protein